MLNDFKGSGHCCTMDGAYMGNIIAMIGHDVWGINIVGAAKLNRVDADIANQIRKMKKGTYKSVG